MKKPAETRMDQAKVRRYWVAVVKPGRVMFMAGVDVEIARDTMRLARNKLPIKTKFITREEMEVGEES